MLSILFFPIFTDIVAHVEFSLSYISRITFKIYLSGLLKAFLIGMQVEERLLLQ